MSVRNRASSKGTPDRSNSHHNNQSSGGKNLNLSEYHEYLAVTGARPLPETRNYVPTSPAPTRNADQDPSIFRLPSHSLDIGTTYEFRVNVTDSAGYSSIATQVGRIAIFMAR